jgi:hypothetical protein
MDSGEDVLGPEGERWLAGGVLLCGYPVVEHEEAARVEHGADQGLAAKALLNHHRHLVADGVPRALDAVEPPDLLFYGIVVSEPAVQDVEEELAHGVEIVVELTHVMFPAGVLLGRAGSLRVEVGSSGGCEHGHALAEATHRVGRAELKKP